GLLNVVHEIVDDVVVTDLDAVLISCRACLLVGTDVEAEDDCTRGLCQRNIALGDRTSARMDDACTHFVGAELVERDVDRFDRTLHVTLDDERELLETRGLQLRHHLLERTALTSLACNGLFTGKTLTVVRNLARLRLVLDYGEAVTSLRRSLKAEDLDRHGRTCALDLLATVIDQGAHTSPLITDGNDVANVERTGVNENRCTRTATLVELGFDDDTFGGAVRVCLEVENFGLQQTGFEQHVNIELLRRPNLDVDNLTTHRFHRHVELQKLVPDLLRVCFVLVDL